MLHLGVALKEVDDGDRCLHILIKNILSLRRRLLASGPDFAEYVQ